MPKNTPPGPEQHPRQSENPKPARSVADMAAQAGNAQAVETGHRQQEAADWPPVEAEILAELDAVDGVAGEGDGFDDFLAEDMPPESPEDPETRLAELSEWIAARFPDLKPYEAAARFCFENEREDPTYRVEDDANLEADIKTHLELERRTERNAIEAGIEDFSGSTEVQRALNKRETRIIETRSQATLAVRYSELLAETGDNRLTIHQLLAETDNPAHQKKLTTLLKTFEAIDAVVPVADQPAIGRIMAATPLNLAGASSIEAFAPVLRAMDAAPEVSEAGKIAVREAVYGQRYINTGSELRDTATAVRIDPQTGKSIPCHTAEKPHPVRPGVDTYTETGDEVLVRLSLPGHPPIVRDVTGWANDEIGLLSEAMGFAAGLEAFGATGAVEDIYKIDFSVLGDSAFDRASVREIRQMMSAMIGAFEGYDGDIFDVRHKKGLIRYQMRLLSGQDSASGWENDRQGTFGQPAQVGPPRR